jgi:hypothetical protein
MKSSTTAFISVKFVHGEFQSNELNSIYETIRNWCHVEVHDFWSFTDTNDGMLIRNYKPQSKPQIMEWKHPISPIKKKLKSQPTVGKVTFTLSWDVHGSVLKHYQERGVSINSAHYTEMLFDELKTEIQSTGWRQVSKGAVFLHDHFHLHTAETLKQLSSEILEHPWQCFKRPSFYQWPWTEGDRAYAAFHPVKNISFYNPEPSVLKRRVTMLKNDALLSYALLVCYFYMF